MLGLSSDEEELKRIISAIKIKEIELCALKRVGKEILSKLAKDRSGGMSLYSWIDISYEDCELVSK